MKTGSTTFLKIFLFVSLFLLTFGVGRVLVSPSHPFVDNNGDGIDDFEEQFDEYKERAARYGVTFPIPELGNCGDYYGCRNFCEDPVNSSTCIAYAQSKGFYKDDPVSVNKDKILDEARREFGCNSVESCMGYCGQPENFDKCDSFAKRNNIEGAGHVTPVPEREFIGKAKDYLGCDSASSCSNLCDSPDNREKCAQFAKVMGVRGGIEQVGPGGCASEASCKTFCTDPANYQVCSGFSNAHGGNFRGPGGCTSEESCKSYCDANPENCGGFRGTGGITGQGPYPYNPAEMCSRTPSCAWAENHCQCGFYGKYEDTIKQAREYRDFCKEDPTACATGGTGGFETGKARGEFERYCSENPERCRTYEDHSRNYDPATECSRYGNCKWENNSCQCGTNPASTGGNYGDTTPEAACARSGSGCYWSNNSCQCPGGSSGGSGTYTYPTPGSGTGGTYDPAAECGRHSGCSWTGSSCNCTGSSTGGSSGGTYTYPTPTYDTPSGTYGTPSYPTPSDSYGTPSYGTPSYGTPSYGTPEYHTPSGEVHGTYTGGGLLDYVVGLLQGWLSNLGLQY